MADTNKTFQHTVDVKFHGGAFRVDISTLGAEILVIEVEEKVTGEKWRGNFKASYIEEITQKTGNFKKFPVFVKMLVNGLSSSSDSVSLDLLSFEDLERLKQSQFSNSRTSDDVKNREIKSKKRYLILTYLGEFDRVHYPLPLHLVEIGNDSSNRRKREQEFRTDSNSLRGSQGLGEGLIVSDIMKSIRAETDLLKSKYQDVFTENSHISTDDIQNADKKKLEEQVDMLTQTVTSQARELESLRKKVERPQDTHRDEEIKILKNALIQLEEDVQRMEIEQRQELKKREKDIQLLLEEIEKLQISETVWREKYNELEAASKSRNVLKTPGKKLTQSPRTPSSRIPTTPQERFDPTAFIRERKKKLDEARGRNSLTRSRSNSRTRTNSSERTPRVPSIERSSKNSRSNSKERLNTYNRKQVSNSAKKAPLLKSASKFKEESVVGIPKRSSNQNTVRIIENTQDDDDHWTQKPINKVRSSLSRSKKNEERLRQLGIRSIEDSPRESKYSDLSESDIEYRNKENYYGKENGETISEKLNSLQNYLSRRKKGI